MYYHQSSKVHQQMLNFFPIPHAVMNEPFYETTEHYCLRDMVHMFTLHICPMATQESYEHCNKIFNSDIVLFVIRKNIANLSVPKWQNINRGKIVHCWNKMPTSQLLVCCCVNLKMKGCFTFLPPWVVRQ